MNKTELGMKSLHLINKVIEGSYKRMGINKIKGEKNNYYSCCWKFKLEDALELIGGSIYFHPTKKDVSSFGGKVLDVKPMKLNGIATEYYTPTVGDEDRSQDRVYFIFESSDEYRGKKWRGADHDMSWTSGIVDDSET